MSNRYYSHEFSNGLRLVVEPISGVRSAAFTLLTPAGAAFDPPDHLGTASLLSLLVTRGAGARDSREFATALDNLGVSRNENTEVQHTSFSAATLADNLIPALELTADMVIQPHLPQEHLEFCKASTIQEFNAIEDDPAQKVFIELKRHALPEPLGRHVLGDQQHVTQVEMPTIRDFHRGSYRPNGSILGVAGAVDFDTVRNHVGRIFESWQPRESVSLLVGKRTFESTHLSSDKIQTHIGLAFDAVSYSDQDFFNAHGAVGVLAGGMSARLLTEIRERRGLCYTVNASFFPLKDRGLVVCYAGTTAERASQTLEVLLQELRRLKDGIGAEEVRRVQAGLKAALIMQEESTLARATIIARGWYNLGRVRSLDEVAGEIDRISPQSILGYLERHPFERYNLLTLGQQPLEVRA